MELNVDERLLLTMILPREGDITTIKIVRELREALSFSEEEHALFEISYNKEQSRVEWNKGKAVPVDIPLGAKAMSVVVEALEKLDKDKKLSEQHISLYDKFMGTTE
jgi:hypothetical protein